MKTVFSKLFLCLHAGRGFHSHIHVSAFQQWNLFSLYAMKNPRVFRLFERSTPCDYHVTYASAERP